MVNATWSEAPMLHFIPARRYARNSLPHVSCTGVGDVTFTVLCAYCLCSMAAAAWDLTRKTRCVFTFLSQILLACTNIMHSTMLHISCSGCFCAVQDIMVSNLLLGVYMCLCLPL